MKNARMEKILTIVFVAAVLIFLFGNKGFRNLVRSYREVSRLKNEFADLEKRNSKLKREIYLLEKEDSYIENIARRELGVISKDEVEYRFKK